MKRFVCCLNRALLILIAIILSSRSFCQIPNYVDTLSLVGWYPFSGNADDHSNMSNHGTVSGAQLTTDRFGNPNSAYWFNAVNDVITTTNAPFLSPPFTISAWLRDTSLAQGQGESPIISLGDLGSNSSKRVYFSHVYGPDPRPSFGVAACSDITSNQPITPTDTNWFFIVMTCTSWSSTGVQFYINGIPNVTNQIHSTSPFPLNNSGFRLGRHTGCAVNDYYDNKMDDLGIWTRVLTSCEIMRLFYSTKTLVISDPVNYTASVGGIASFAISDTGTSAIFQWQVNSGSGFSNIVSAPPYSGENAKTLVINPVSSGMANFKYRCIRIGSGCTDTSSFAQLIINPTNITDLAYVESQIAFYPNPSTGSFSINAPVKVESIEVRNLLGQLVKCSCRTGSPTNVDISTLSSGWYVVRVNGIYNKRILKE